MFLVLFHHCCCLVSVVILSFLIFGSLVLLFYQSLYIRFNVLGFVILSFFVNCS